MSFADELCHMNFAAAHPNAAAHATTGAGVSSRAAGHAFTRWDPWIGATVAALMLFGLLMVYSASVSLGEKMGNSLHYLLRHGANLAAGAVVLLVAMRVNLKVWERMGPILMISGLVLLVLVLIPGVGTVVNGSSRWLRLGIANVQPSEFIKLFMLVYVAGYLVRKQDELQNFTQGILIISVVLALVGGLLLQEPDFGSLVVITFTVFTMLFLAGVRFWHFLATLGAGIGGMVALTIASPYRMDRVTGFLDPWVDPFNTGFQLVQALIAFGRGEWFGVGLGASVQKLFYLPAAHTDFLLAIIAEELGVVGVLAVIALFAIFVARAFMIAKQAERAGALYGARLAQGIGLLLGMQAMVNMGVNMGVLPTKGLTLPFMSYGGSSILVCCALAGILLRIERDSRMGVAR